MMHSDARWITDAMALSRAAIRWSAAVIVAAAVGAGGCDDKPTAIAGVTDHDQLYSLLASYRRSINELDLDLAQRIWLDSDEVSLFHSSGYKEGRAAIFDGYYRGEMGKLRQRELRFDDIELHITGDAAWAEFLWTFDATIRNGTAASPAGESIATSGRETQIYRRTPAGWRIVHVHYSSVSDN